MPQSLRDPADSGVVSADATYWRARLAGLGDRTCFVADLYPDPGAGPSRAVHSVRLPEPLAARLDAMSRNQPHALHVVLTAAMAVLVHRHTGAEEVVVGQPTLADPSARSNRLLVLRVPTDPAVSFREVLLRLRGDVLAALEHQDFPVLDLAAELGRTVDAGENPYVDVAVELAGIHDPGFAAEVPVRLLVTAERRDGGTTVTLRYDATRYTADTAGRIVRHYLLLLEQVSADPDLRLGDVDLHTAEDDRVVAASNATAVEWDETETLMTRFVRQVRATPTAPAVVGPDGTVLSYQQFADRVSRLAGVLRRHGVGPDDVVGVLAERSVESVTAIFAVLAAGGGYLPLDPSYPRARLEYLLADSGARLVLAQPGTADGLDPDVAVVDLAPPQDGAAEPLRPGCAAGDLAYVIYTSGSTGTPKGVQVEHRSAVNRLAWMQRAYPIGPGEVILHKTSVSFDVSVWELFWWAGSGATLALLAPGGEKDPATIVEAVEAHRVTTMHFVPSMLAMFLGHVGRFGAAPRLGSLRRVFASGEALGRQQVRRFADLLPGARLVNLYGPTEATVDVSHQPCDPASPLARVPIGRPIDNLRLYVLDTAGRPAPVGVPGELYVAGAGVARGYLNRPELTAERFVSGDAVGEDRLYRTGDRARWLPDGTVDFLGRVDQQVKVRGFRVEPGEVEERLRAHPQVRDAAVVAVDDGWQTSLRGFVVLDGSVGAGELKAHLRETLPEHMVPDRLVPLAALPLTPNGKLDRRALTRPGAVRRMPEHVPPRTESEHTLAGIWQEVLGVPRVGVLDNFFALGGNSIHFVSVLARARAAGLDFTFQQLFQHQTVAALAEVMGAGPDGPAVGAGAPAGPTPPDGPAGPAAHAPFTLLDPADRALVPADAEDAYPLSMLQAGLIFQTEITGGLGQYHDVLGYLVSGPFDRDAFERAVRTMVRRHPVLRTTYHLTGYSEFVQVVHRDCEPPLTVVDLRHLTAEEQERYNDEWVAREKARRFEWDRGGLVSLHVQILSDDQCRYTVSQHNSALDGWSISLLHTQLFELYHAYRDGGEPDERTVDNHLRSFVGLERAATASPESRDFWLGVLDGAECTALPRRHGAVDSTDFQVRFHDVPLPAGLTERIVALAEDLSVPVKDVLLAAHVKVVGEAAGTAQVLTGYEHSGRPELPDADAALGLFLNTVPFRIDLTGGTWADLVRRVYQAEVDLLPHRRYPMARMKQNLGTRRTLFETTFNFTHFYLLKNLRQLPEFDLMEMRVDSETEFVFRTEFSRNFLDDRVELSLHYHTHLFDAEQIDRIGGYLVRALELMTQVPDERHDARPLAGDAELALLGRFGDAAREEADRRYGELVGGGALPRVVNPAGLPTPLGTPGEVVLGGLADPPAAAQVEPDRMEPGRYAVRTGDAGRWLPDGRLEFLGRLDRQRPVGDAAPPPGPQAAAPAAPSTQEPGSAAQVEIAAVWRRVLDLHEVEIGPQDSFFELGGNSLSALRVVLELDGLVTLTDLTRHPRLGQLARLVEQRTGDEAEELVHLLSSTAAGTRCALVCFPYPAGHPINFRPLADTLEEQTSDVAVYGVEQPGHDQDRPGPFVGVEETARRVVAEIAEKIDTPLLLWGHCGGASVTVEVARQLEEQGHDLRGVLIGSKLLPPVEEMQESIDLIEGWTDDDIVRYLVDETGYTDLEGLDPRQTEFTGRVFRHDVLNGYRYFIAAVEGPQWTIKAPFWFVVASDDAGLAHYPGEYPRWGRLAADLRLHVVGGGGHYFVRSNPTGTAELVQRAWADVAAGSEEN